MPFTFKQFHIDDQGCGMPVSTDAVILGAWAKLESAEQILDIGAGSGLLSLMAAQRSKAQITAVEIDEAAARVCQQNIDASPWANRVKLLQGNIGAIAEDCSDRYDHIICNPPYFQTGPKSLKAGRALARHTDTLSFELLLDVIDKLLTSQGVASLILPIESVGHWMKALTKVEQLCLHSQCQIQSVRDKPCKRVLLSLKRPSVDNTVYEEMDLVIRERDNSYSQTMTELTRDFYLFL